jgi:hypothetical protein
MALGVHVLDVEFDPGRFQKAFDGPGHLSGVGKGVMIGMENQDALAPEFRRRGPAGRAGRRQNGEQQPEDEASEEFPATLKAMVHG